MIIYLCKRHLLCLCKNLSTRTRRPHNSINTSKVNDAYKDKLSYVVYSSYILAQFLCLFRSLTIDNLKKQQETCNLKLENLAKSDASLRKEISKLQQQNIDSKSALDSRINTIESLNESIYAKDALIEVSEVKYTIAIVVTSVRYGRL